MPDELLQDIKKQSQPAFLYQNKDGKEEIETAKSFKLPYIRTESYEEKTTNESPWIKSLMQEVVKFCKLQKIEYLYSIIEIRPCEFNYAANYVEYIVKGFSPIVEQTFNCPNCKKDTKYSMPRRYSEQYPIKCEHCKEIFLTPRTTPEPTLYELLDEIQDLKETIELMKKESKKQELPSENMNSQPPMDKDFIEFVTKNDE
jgi:transcription elongation factor Elf1